MERFARQAADALSKALPPFSDPAVGARVVKASDLEVPPDPKMGDFAFPCFRLAKEFRKSPNDAAKEIVSLLTEKKAVPPSLSVAAVGPYVNFTVAPKDATGALLGDILAGEGNGTYGSVSSEKPRGTWLMEYSSPNVAKPFMIYHFRGTGLGACLDRVGRYRGYKMVSINHLGDWGTQFGKLYVAHELYGKELPAEPGIADLVKIYVKLHEAIEKDPTLEDRARAAFKRLEQRDPEVVANWKKCIEISMREFNALYAKLDVHFDHIWGESFYEEQLRPLLAALKKADILVQSEGAWVVHVTDEKGRELIPCILEKSDGSTIYATRDVAAAIYRHEKYSFDRMTYIVGGEQKLHFQQVFGVLRRMGKDWVSKMEHIPTGLYRFKDAKMSTRKGNFVTLQDVWDMAIERVRTLMKERGSSAEMSPAEIDEVSEKVAIAAIVFHDLHSDPARDVEFDVERVVDFEGETGPYLQYAHTRCLSILRKAAEQSTPLPKLEKSAIDRAVASLTKEEETQLLKTLGQFPLHLERTLEHRKASQLAHYLVDVVKAYGDFYRECHVLGQAREITEARLLLVEATRRVLAQGLRMLGIPVPSRM
jgi:arginyl-tRNA synthetase